MSNENTTLINHLSNKPDGNLDNGSNLCYLNSATQMLVSSPSFRQILIDFQKKFPNVPEYSKLMANSELEQEDYEKCRDFYYLCLGILGENFKDRDLKGIKKDNLPADIKMGRLAKIAAPEDNVDVQKDSGEFITLIIRPFNEITYKKGKEQNNFIEIGIAGESYKVENAPIMPIEKKSFNYPFNINDPEFIDDYRHEDKDKENGAIKELNFIPIANKDFTIHLKRFESDLTGEAKKIIDKIKDPLQYKNFKTKVFREGLDLNSFISTDIAYSEIIENFPEQECTISSFVVHTGHSMKGGHYISYIRVGESTWAELDSSDNKTRVLNDKEIEGPLSESYLINFMPSDQLNKEIESRKLRLSSETLERVTEVEKGEQLSPKQPKPSNRAKIDQSKLPDFRYSETKKPPANGKEKYSVDEIIEMQKQLDGKLDFEQFFMEKTHGNYHCDWWVVPSTTNELYFNSNGRYFNYDENDREFYKTLGDKRENFYTDMITAFNELTDAGQTDFYSYFGKVVECISRISQYSEKFKNNNKELLRKFVENIEKVSKKKQYFTYYCKDHLVKLKNLLEIKEISVPGKEAENNERKEREKENEKNKEKKKAEKESKDKAGKKESKDKAGKKESKDKAGKKEKEDKVGKKEKKKENFEIPLSPPKKQNWQNNTQNSKIIPINNILPLSSKNRHKNQNLILEKQKKKDQTMIYVAVIIILAIVSFVGMHLYNQNQASTASTNNLTPLPTTNLNTINNNLNTAQVSA